MNPAPAFRLHLSDSELARLVSGPAAGRLVLELAAASVERLDGTPPSAGYLGGVRLVFDGVTPDTPWPAGATGRIAHARLHDGRRWLATLPLPGTLAGALRLDATLPHGDTLALAARALSLELDDPARFRESLAC